MKRSLLLIFMLLSELIAYAQFNAPYPVWKKKTGNWTDASGWSTGQVPGPNATVGVSLDCGVTITTEVFAGNMYVEEDAELIVAESGILHVNHAGPYGAIRMFDKSKLIIDGKVIMGDTNPLYSDAIAAGLYMAGFVGAKPDIIVNKTGSLSIGNTTGAGIFLFTGGSITNHGSIDIGKLGPMGFAEGENVGSAGFYTFGASLTNTGTITIDDIRSVDGRPNNPALMVSPGLFNTGEIRIGQLATIKGAGVVAGDTISNSGTIVVDNAYSGIAISKLNNTGQIKMGQLGPISSRGIYSMRSTSLLVNQGEILLDNIAGDAFALNGVSIINQKNIFIGKTHSIGGSGFGLGGSAIDNRNRGTIQVKNCGNHPIRLGTSVFTNAGITDVMGFGNVKTDAVYLDNSTFNNNEGGLVKLDKIRKSGVHLRKSRFDNRGQLKLMETDTIPVLMQAESVFNNYGTLDASESKGEYGGIIAVTEGSSFMNREGGNATLSRSAPKAPLPALNIHDDGSKFLNSGLLTIGLPLAPLNYDAIQVDGHAFLFNDRPGVIKVVNTERNGLTVLNKSEFVNNGMFEFYDVAGIPVYATSESLLDNEGIIKTGLGTEISSVSLFLEGKVIFRNRPRGEIYLNKGRSSLVGLEIRAGTVIENNGKIVWGNAASSEISYGLGISDGSSFRNRPSAILEFTNVADAINCDATAGVPQTSNFVNEGIVRFGNVRRRGFYNSDPTFLFNNNGVFETMPGGKMDLRALIRNATTNSKLNNADGTVTTAYAFINAGTITNGGIFNSREITNEGTVINNGTWNASAAFTNNNRYQGSGVFRGAMFNNLATLMPGNSPGCASFGNGFTFQQTGVLRIEVNGNTACTQFDQVNVTGTAELTGGLNVTFGAGYTPGSREEIIILKATAINGTFRTNNLPAGWSIAYGKPNTGDVTLMHDAGPLPLTLLRFAVQKEGGAAHASWTTTDEINTSHFDLESSTDGKQFRKVTTVTAVNAAGEHQYHFTDNSPSPGRSYYRLKMSDRASGAPERDGLDGMYTYSRIVTFDMEKGKTLIAAIYPNPATDIVNLKIAENSDHSIQILSQEGKSILTRKLSQAGTQELDVSAVPAGIYILKISNGEAYKLIKQ